MHSPDAAGSNNPDTVGGFSRNPLLPRKKVNPAKQGFLQMQNLPIYLLILGSSAGKSETWAGPQLLVSPKE